MLNGYALFVLQECCKQYTAAVKRTSVEVLFHAVQLHDTVLMASLRVDRLSGSVCLLGGHIVWTAPIITVLVLVILVTGLNLLDKRGKCDCIPEYEDIFHLLHSGLEKL